VLGRVYTDIDLAGYSREATAVYHLFARSLGYTADQMIYVETEGARMIFEQANHGVRVDVFFDILDFNHTVSWRNRLERDAPYRSARRTLPKKRRRLFGSTHQCAPGLLPAFKAIPPE